MQRRQKNWLKYTDCAELNKINITIFCSIYSSLFSSPLNFVAVCFVWLKKLQLTVQVSCLFYFLFLSIFFKGKVKNGFCGGFHWLFLSGLFKIKRWIFLGQFFLQQPCLDSYKNLWFLKILIQISTNKLEVF